MDTTVDSGVAPKPGHWQQVVGTWDGVDISIYINGKLKGTVESTKRPSSSSTFYVGYGELAPWFAGSIDEVAYYPIGLAPARVYQLWLADPPADLSKGDKNAAACKYIANNVLKAKIRLNNAVKQLTAAKKSGSPRKIAQAKAKVKAAQTNLLKATLTQKKYC